MCACITQWVENIDGWERFSRSHPFLVEMLQVIVNGNSEFQMYDGWSPEDKRNALAHLKAIESFEFVYVVNTLHHSLYYLKLLPEGGHSDTARILLPV